MDSGHTDSVITKRTLPLFLFALHSVGHQEWNEDEHG